jgi:hypothetical protein
VLLHAWGPRGTSPAAGHPVIRGQSIVGLSWNAGRSGGNGAPLPRPGRAPASAYFFERDEELRRERDEGLERREEPLDFREPDELPDLRPVRPLAEVRLRDLPPVLRLARVGFARREALFDEALFEDEPFVSPAFRRCLLTTRAASCSARPSLAPCLRADCLILAY